MGKPRMIILVRHAQSEGNKNRDIHQFVPDHRVKLTPDGWQQALEAGKRLRGLLKPDDTLQFFTSPYRRTRETTEGILQTLTADDADQGPSPFPRHAIKVFEEPRLREQDFGNFQPCSAEMERMWQERADYGHFFYRIPNGESAADAYDRVSGFNESLWRQFGDADFPSVCVLVTHGLMSRIFLMKWYHWSVEYFEDLRNVNHCEFIIMKQKVESGKFELQNQLRTWSELKRRNSQMNAQPKPPKTGAVGLNRTESFLPTRKWGGCAQGCDHAHHEFPRATKRESALNLTNVQRGLVSHQSSQNVKEDHPLASTAEQNEADQGPGTGTPGANGASSKSFSKMTSKSSKTNEADGRTEDVDPLDNGDEPSAFQNGRDDDEVEADDASSEGSLSEELDKPLSLHVKSRAKHTTTLKPTTSRDSHTTETSDESDYFDTRAPQFGQRMSISSHRSDVTRGLLGRIEESGESTPLASPSKRGSSIRKRPTRTSSVVSVKSERGLLEDSGMMNDRRANALGDVGDEETDGDADEHAMPGESVVGQVIQDMKDKDRRSLSEVY